MTSENGRPKIDFAPGIIQGDVNFIVGNANTIGPKTSQQDDSASSAPEVLAHNTAKPKDAAPQGIVRSILGWLARIARLAASIVKGALVVMLGARLKAIFG